MRPRDSFLALGLSLFLLVEPAAATCGGGGGGGKGGAGSTYETTWTRKDWEMTLRSAGTIRQGVVLYFPPVEQDLVQHRFFRTKIANDASKERLFFKAVGEAGKELRALYRPRPDRHVIHVVDWYGNSFKVFEARDDEQKIRAKALKSTLYAMDKLVKRLEKALDAKIGTAEKDGQRERYASAAETAREILAYRGYPAVARARALLGRIEKTGTERLEAALRIEDEGRRRKELGTLKRLFRGTSVEARAERALRGRQGSDDPGEEPKDDASSDEGGASLGEAVWDEVFGQVDFEALPPSTAERVEALVQAGIAREEAGRYEEARDAYALAAGLDLDDPIPLIYLGEVYRHHLGDWERAERVFRRVLELDNSDFAVAIALHGIGKMTIWRGDNEKGLALFARSIARRPTALCYRNLAVYWNTEGDARLAFDYAAKAFALDPEDAYNQVFYAVYLLLNDRPEEARRLIAKADFDPSMSYNLACYHAVLGHREEVLRHLKRHFYEYEHFDAVRAFEMAEARMDAFFEPWRNDPAFVRLTHLAGKTPWLEGGR